MYELIERIAATRSRTAKRQLLEAHKDCRALKLFFKLALDKTLTFGCCERIGCCPKPQCEHSDLFGALSWLAKHAVKPELSGNALRATLITICEELSVDDRELFNRVLEKAPLCGLGAGEVNKVWPNLIHQQQYCGCAHPKADTEYASGGIVMLKEAGLQVMVEIHFAPFSVVARDRTGLIFNLPSELQAQLEQYGRHLMQYYYSQIVDEKGALLCCEGLMIAEFEERDGAKQPVMCPVVNNSRPVVLTESKSNGLWGKGLEGTMCEVGQKSAMLVVQDIVPLGAYLGESICPAWKNRESEYNSAVRVLSLGAHVKRLYAVHSEKVDCSSAEENKRFVQAVSRRFIAHKYEGAVWRSPDHRWTNGKPSTQLKVKAKDSADLRIVGFKPHKRDKSQLGSLICVIDGNSKFKVAVSSGLTASDRARSFSDFEDQIVRVEYHRVSDTGKSLMNPRFNHNSTVFEECLRDDKGVTTSLCECYAAVAAAEDFLSSEASSDAARGGLGNNAPDEPRTANSGLGKNSTTSLRECYAAVEAAEDFAVVEQAATNSGATALSLFSTVELDADQGGCVADTAPTPAPLMLSNERSEPVEHGSRMSAADALSLAGAAAMSPRQGNREAVTSPSPAPLNSRRERSVNICTRDIPVSYSSRDRPRAPTVAAAQSVKRVAAVDESTAM